MRREPIEYRVCLKCKEEKRTTVRVVEEKEYVCEDCLRLYGKELILGGSTKRGGIILAILIVAAWIFGYLIGKA